MELGTKCCDCCAIHKSIDGEERHLTDARGDLNDEEEMREGCELKSTVNWFMKSALVVVTEPKALIKGDNKEGCVECLFLSAAYGIAKTRTVSVDSIVQKQNKG